MVMIVDISSQLSARLMRPVPHFNDFLVTINYFIDFKQDEAFFSNWLRGLSEIAFNPQDLKRKYNKVFQEYRFNDKRKCTSESGSVKWKVKSSKLKFEHDTVFYVANNQCYT